MQQMFHTCVSVWKIAGYTHVIIGLAVIKIWNINKSLISLVGLHFLAAHLQSTLHSQHFWHHGDKVPAIKLALGVAILTHHTSFLANDVSTAIARYSLEWPVNLLSASWFVSELSRQRVDVSASWFVSEMSVKRCHLLCLCITSRMYRYSETGRNSVPVLTAKLLV